MFYISCWFLKLYCLLKSSVSTVCADLDAKLNPVSRDKSSNLFMAMYLNWIKIIAWNGWLILKKGLQTVSLWSPVVIPFNNPSFSLSREWNSYSSSFHEPVHVADARVHHCGLHLGDSIWNFEKWKTFLQGAAQETLAERRIFLAQQLF